MFHITQPMTQLSMSEFQLTSDESKALTKFREIADNYAIDNTPMIDFQTYFSLTNNLGIVEKSNVIYYKVLRNRMSFIIRS